jgi:hypothetical protein
MLILEKYDDGFGTETLKEVGGPIKTAGELAAAVERLAADAAGDGGAIVWIATDGMPTGVMSATAGQGGVYVNAAPPGPPPFVPAELFSHGLDVETGGRADTPAFLALGEDGQFEIAGARLEKHRDTGLVAVALLPGRPAGAGGAPRDADVDGPQKAGEFRDAVRRLAAASNRPDVGSGVLVCSVPAEDGDIYCVVDSVSARGRNAMLDLMSVTPDELMRMQDDPGMQALDYVAAKCGRLPADAYLFFMYKGKPYAADELGARSGMPSLMTLIPWQDAE